MMKTTCLSFLLAYMCLAAGGCLDEPGEQGQLPWHQNLGFAQVAVLDSLQSPSSLFSDQQLRFMLSWTTPDEEVSAAELLTGIDDEYEKNEVLRDLASMLDRPGVRDALGLGDSTTTAVDETLPGRFWLFKESLHFSKPLPPGYSGFYTYCFYVKDGTVGAAIVITDGP